VPVAAIGGQNFRLDADTLTLRLKKAFQANVKQYERDHPEWRVQ